MDIPTLISVVDDDESVRESLPDLLKEFGFAAQSFSSAEEFLTSNYLHETKCLILDVAIEAHAIGVAIVPAVVPIAPLLRERRRGGHRESCNYQSGKGAMLHDVTPWLCS